MRQCKGFVIDGVELIERRGLAAFYTRAAPLVCEGGPPSRVNIYIYIYTGAALLVYEGGPPSLVKYIYIYIKKIYINNYFKLICS